MLESVHTCTFPLFSMMHSLMHFCVQLLLISDSPPPLFSLFFFFHITFVRRCFVNILPLNLSVSFDRGLFCLNSFQKARGGGTREGWREGGWECKELHLLLNNIMATWEATARHLHLAASVSLFGKQSKPGGLLLLLLGTFLCKAGGAEKPLHLASCF